MILAFAGDWHGNLAYARSAVEYASIKGAKYILHVGDFGYNFETKFLDGLQDMLEEKKMYLYFIDGNHENFHLLYTYPLDPDVRPLRERITHLPRGYRWQWNDTTFLALGGAVSVDKDYRIPGKEWWPEEAITFLDADTAIAGGRVDVMICHDAPDGVEIESIKNNPFGFPEHSLRAAQNHREMLRAVVDEVRPNLIASGHYHTRQTAYLQGKDYTARSEILDCDGSKFAKNMMFMEI